MNRPFAVAALVLTAFCGQAMAKPGTPGAEWFTGSYDRVGRDAAGELLNDQVSIAPYGDGLQIAACSGRDSVLSFGPVFEIVNLLSGNRGQAQIACLFHNNGYARPILTCQTEDGAAFTLWPMAAGNPQGC
jgi:hypothetical protein